MEKPNDRPKSGKPQPKPVIEAPIPAASNNQPINNGKGPLQIDPPGNNKRGNSPPKNRDRSPNRGRGRGRRNRSRSPEGPIIVNVNVTQPNQPAQAPQQININQSNVIQHQPAAPPPPPGSYNDRNNNYPVSPPQVRPAIIAPTPQINPQPPVSNQIHPCKDF